LGVGWDCWGRCPAAFCWGGAVWFLLFVGGTCAGGSGGLAGAMGGRCGVVGGRPLDASVLTAVRVGGARACGVGGMIFILGVCFVLLFFLRCFLSSFVDRTHPRRAGRRVPFGFSCVGPCLRVSLLSSRGVCATRSVSFCGGGGGAGGGPDLRPCAARGPGAVRGALGRLCWFRRPRGSTVFFCRVCFGSFPGFCGLGGPAAGALPSACVVGVASVVGFFLLRLRFVFAWPRPCQSLLPLWSVSGPRSSLCLVLSVRLVFRMVLVGPRLLGLCFPVYLSSASVGCHACVRFGAVLCWVPAPFTPGAFRRGCVAPGRISPPGASGPAPSAPSFSGCPSYVFPSGLGLGCPCSLLLLLWRRFFFFGYPVFSLGCYPLQFFLVLLVFRLVQFSFVLLRLSLFTLRTLRASLLLSFALLLRAFRRALLCLLFSRFFFLFSLSALV